MDPTEILRRFNTSACWQAFQDLGDWQSKGGLKPCGLLSNYSLKLIANRNPSLTQRLVKWIGINYLD